MFLTLDPELIRKHLIIPELPWALAELGPRKPSVADVKN